MMSKWNGEIGGCQSREKGGDHCEKGLQVHCWPWLNEYCQLLYALVCVKELASKR